MGCGCSVSDFFSKQLWRALACFCAASAVAPHLTSNRGLWLCFCSSCVLVPSLDLWPGLLTLCSLAVNFVYLNPCVESLVFKWLLVGKENKVLMGHWGTVIKFSKILGRGMCWSSIIFVTSGAFLSFSWEVLGCPDKPIAHFVFQWTWLKQLKLSWAAASHVV